MTLSKECRDVLACPKCKGPLDYRSEEQRFVCFLIAVFTPFVRASR